MKIFRENPYFYKNWTEIWGTLHKESSSVLFYLQLFSREGPSFKGRWYQFCYFRRSCVNISRICQIVTSYTNCLFVLKLSNLEW